MQDFGGKTRRKWPGTLRDPDTDGMIRFKVDLKESGQGLAMN